MPQLLLGQNSEMAYLYLAASMMMVGAYVGFSKLLVAVFPVFLLAWLRFAIAGVAMFSWLRRPPDEMPLDRHTQMLVFFEAFLGNFMFSICMLWGMRYASAITAGVIMATMPAIVALLSWLFLRERLSLRTQFALLLAVLGVATLAFSNDNSTGATDQAYGLGTALLIGAAFCEASYVVIGKRLTSNLSPKRITAMVNAWGLLLMMPLGLWAAHTFDFSSVPPLTWGGLVLYALAASVWTVWLWMTGLKSIPSSKAGIFTVFLPITAATIGVIFLGERFTMLHALAFICALAGVVLATWPEKTTTLRK